MAAASPAAIIDDIYEAALDDQLWKRAIDGVARASGGYGGALVLWDKTSGRLPVAHNSCFSEQLWREYSTHYVNLDPRNVLLARSDLELYTDQMLCEPDELRRSDCINYVYSQCEQRHGYGARLFSGALYDSTLILARTGRQDAAQQADINALAQFLPHLRRSIALSRKVGQQVSTAALDALSFGIAILDEQGRVSFANQRLRAMAAERDGLTLAGDGLALEQSGENASYQRAVGMLRRRNFFGNAPTRTALLASRPSGRRPYSILACPFSRFASMLPEANQSVLVCVSDPAQTDHLNEALLAALFELTAAEARLAISLVQRGSLSAAAADCGLTDGSARQYLKRIYGKTGTQGQVDLVALILGSVRS